MDRLPRFQFSLLTMLALTAVVAATSAAVSSPPNWISGLALGFLSFAFPTAFVLVIVYGEGYWRAFCIGALVPSFEGWVMSGLAVMLVTADSFTGMPSAAPAVAVVPAPGYSGATPYPTYTAPGATASAPIAEYADAEATLAALPATTDDPNAIAAATDDEGDATADTANIGVSFSGPAPPTTTWQTTTTSTDYGVEYNAVRPLAASFAQIFRVGGALYWTFAVALGFFAVGVRWLIERAKVRSASAVKGETEAKMTVESAI